MYRLCLSITFTLLIYYSYSQVDTITFDGQQRTYRIHLPVNYDPDTLYPLVLNLHGLGSNSWEQEVYTEFNNVADTGRFIVVYPDGINNSWNVSSSSGTNDVGFISALIDSINSYYVIDLQRVYATGMSMGGFMSYRLACELSNRIAAIGSVAGLQAFYPCTPSRPVPVIDFHGTSDQVVPYIGVATTINNWVGYNGCPAEPVISDLPDIEPGDNSTVTVSYYGLCNDSSEVILYTINGGEHTWPGAPILIGITNQDIKASNEIWGFFTKYTLQGSTGTGEALQSNDNFLKFFPNPLHGFTTVEVCNLHDQLVNLRIQDMNGRILKAYSNIGTQRFLIDCSALSPGLYMAVAEIDGISYHQKLIVR